MMGDLNSIHENIAANMKRRRADVGMSLEDVASACGMSKSGIWELEQGRNPNPTIRTVLKVCSALSMSLNSLLGIDVAQPQNTDAELALIAAHRRLFPR